MFLRIVVKNCWKAPGIYIYIYVRISIKPVSGVPWLPMELATNLNMRDWRGGDRWEWYLQMVSSATMFQGMTL